MHVIINFSGRTDGNCHKIGAYLVDLIPDSRLIDFGDISISPCGRCENECFQDRQLCPYRSDGVVDLYQMLDAAESAVFVVPNYSDYPCANFFMFNERSQCWFQGREDLLERYLAVSKQFVVVSNTMQENFWTIFRYHVSEATEPDILFLRSRDHGVRSIDGNLIACREVQARLSSFIQD